MPRSRRSSGSVSNPFKPVVEKVKQGGKKVLDGYLNLTNKLADKVEEVLPDDLPKFKRAPRRQYRKD